MSDGVHEVLTDYAVKVAFGDVNPEVIDGATSRVLDTFGALVAGFGGEPCRMLRQMATELYPQPGAAIVGTRRSTSVEMAAFVNGTTARFAELNDTYHVPGKSGVHASDVIMPLVAVGEYRHSTGPELIAAVIAAYEVCLAMADASPDNGFDYTNFVALGVAVGSSTLLGLSEDAIRQCISLSVVSGNALRRVRTGDVSMWKSAASGQAGRAGVFAALLAARGMGAPNLPFTGTYGWLDAVAGQPIELVLPEPADSRRLLGTILKPRGACGTTIPSILAAEAVFRQGVDVGSITGVVVETYRDAVRKNASGEHHWAPTTRETADHSIPYVVAAALSDGTVGPAQYDEGHLRSPALRDLLAKVRVEENRDFSEAYRATPVVHRTRVTVELDGGEVLHGDAGGSFGDISDPMTRREVTDKFTGLAGPSLGDVGAAEFAQRIWSLDSVGDIGVLPGFLAALGDSGE
jgi:2-methylcitrate dehydratase